MMSLLRRLLVAGLAAGFIAGVAVTAVQHLQVIPLIQTAEVYEEIGTPAAHAHTHEAGAAHDRAAHDHAAHDHGDGWAPQDGVERTLFTLLANVLAGVGYGALLVAGMAFAGRRVDARRGLLWGAAGFAAFSLAPALGLPPELPGMAAADLASRQLWWIATAVATLAGIALLAFNPGRSGTQRGLVQTAAVLLIALPHLVGTPIHVSGGYAPEAGALPAELAARFAVAALLAQAAFWAVLSLVAGHLMGRVLTVTALAPRPAAA